VKIDLTNKTIQIVKVENNKHCLSNFNIDVAKSNKQLCTISVKPRSWIIVQQPPLGLITRRDDVWIQLAYRYVVL
jgi:hypothetical protein